MNGQNANALRGQLNGSMHLSAVHILDIVGLAQALGLHQGERDVDGMVADAFVVRDGKGHLRDAVSLVPSHIESSDFDEFLCNGVGEIIDGIFGIFDLSIFIVGWIEEALTDELRFSLAMRPILVISSCACRRATAGGRLPC